MLTTLTLVTRHHLPPPPPPRGPAGFPGFRPSEGTHSSSSTSNPNPNPDYSRRANHALRDLPYHKMELEPTLSRKELRKMYKKLCLKLHPDKGGSAADFRRMHDAYVKIVQTLDDLFHRFPTFNPGIETADEAA